MGGRRYCGREDCSGAVRNRRVIARNKWGSESTSRDFVARCVVATCVNIGYNSFQANDAVRFKAC